MTTGVAKLGWENRLRVQPLPPEAARAEPPSGGAALGAYGECGCDRRRRGWWRGSPVGAGGAVRTVERPEVAQAVNGATKTARDTHRGTHGKRYPWGGCNALDHSAIQTGSTTKKPL